MAILRALSWWGVYSVWLRHARLYRRTWLINCLPPISEPVVYLLSFGFGVGPLIKTVSYMGHPVEYIHFIAPGMMAVGILFQSFLEGAYGTYIRIRFEQSWQAQLTTPLTLPEIYAGDWIWGATRGSIVGLVTGLVAVLWGIYPLGGLLQSLPIIFCGGLLFSALGMAAAGFAKTVDQINVPTFLIIVPMFAICGTYFPRDVLPPVFRSFVDLLPLAMLVDLLRAPILSPSPVSTFTTLALLAGLFAWTALFATFGWRKNRRWVVS